VFIIVLLFPSFDTVYIRLAEIAAQTRDQSTRDMIGVCVPPL